MKKCFALFLSLALLLSCLLAGAKASLDRIIIAGDFFGRLF